MQPSLQNDAFFLAFHCPWGFVHGELFSNYARHCANKRKPKTLQAEVLQFTWKIRLIPYLDLPTGAFCCFSDARRIAACLAWSLCGGAIVAMPLWLCRSMWPLPPPMGARLRAVASDTVLDTHELTSSPYPLVKEVSTFRDC